VKLNLISLATVKTQLGLTVTTYDATLTALIPIVSADVRRILNTEYNKYYACSFSSSSTLIDLSLYTYRKYEQYSGIAETQINIGTVLYNANLPDDTYVSEFDPLTGLFTLSATPTGVGSYVYPSISIAQWPVISKMIWYKYSKMNTKSASARGVSSESLGDLSITYSPSEINAQWDYPSVLLDDLGKPNARIG
jgi:hypothetical protein